MTIEFVVNQKHIITDVDPLDSLLDVLRNKLGLTGAKRGCGEGYCGACTVLIDGKPANSCIVLAVETNGRNIMTIEGVERDSRWQTLQRNMIDNSSAQCGFCAPGMIMNLVGILSEEPDISEHELKRNLAGNLCRCGSHYKVINAVKMFQAAEASIAINGD